MGKETSAKNSLTLNEQAVQITLLVFLCLMSFQPLVGLTTQFLANSLEEFTYLVGRFFLMKSELIRFNGYALLLISILVVILREKVDIFDSFKVMYYKKPWNICFSLLLLWTCINVFVFSPGLDVSLNGDAYRYEGLFSVIGYAGFFAAASLIKDEKLKKIWMNVTITASVVLGICAVYSLYAENPIVLKYMNRQIIGEGALMATFPQFNHYGYYLCIMLVLSAGLLLNAETKKGRFIYMAALAFHQYVLSLNGTRGAQIAAYVAVIFLSVLSLVRKSSDKKQIVIMWSIIMLGTLPAFGNVWSRLVYTADEVNQIITNTPPEGLTPSGRKRLELWSNSIELIKLHPIRGFGLNMASYALNMLRGIQDMPHNEYLQHFVDLGLIGISLYLGALISLFVSTIKKIKELPFACVVAGCGVIAYAVSAFFGVTIVEVLPFFYILLGFVKWERPVAVTETETPAETVEESENVAEAVEEVADENI